jgi:deoxyuridine 5'-triphosphate nucleotidohydrolase
MNNKMSFNNLQNEEEVYLFGWIVGSNPENNTISLEMTDIHVLSCLKKIIPSVKVVSSFRNFRADFELPIFNQNFKDNIPEQFKWVFMRGLFDGYGNIEISRNGEHKCLITCNSPEIKEFILSNCEVSNFVIDNTIFFSSVNVIDFLSMLYDHSTPTLRSPTKYGQYVDIVNWSSISNTKIPLCKFSRTNSNAVIPMKNRATDEGYDLTIVEVFKRLGENTVLYDTCIKLLPEFGYYFDIVPRSSLSKSGYCFTNSVGIIDRSYRGTVKIALTKIDNSFPDIELPYRCAQIILRKSNHYCFVESDDVDNTNRGEGGFGSTGV